MGMSASQARMLSLTARLSDLEYQAQSVSNSKIRLADAASEASQAYNDALNGQKLTVLAGVNTKTEALTYVDATAYNLTTYGAVSTTDKQRFIKDASGKVLVSENVGAAYDSANGNLSTFLSALNIITNPSSNGYDSSKVLYYTNVFNEISQSGGYDSPGDDNMKDSTWLQAQVNAGNVYLYTYDSKGGADGTGDFVNVSWTSGDSSIQEATDSSGTAKAEAKYETTMAQIESQDKKFDLQLKQIDTEHNAIQTEIDSVKKVIDKNIERSFKIFNA